MTKAQITGIEITDFQGIKSLSLTLPQLLFIFGENGAGKTSIGEALAWVLGIKSDRFKTLGQLVRQGAETAEVILRLSNGYNFTRTQGEEGERLVNGEPVKEKVYEAELREALGVSPEAIAAALRSGQLLSMSAADLQKLLQKICAVEITAEDISGELEHAEAGLKRIKIAMPKTQTEIIAACVKVEKLRLDAKREKEQLTADVENARAGIPDLALASEAKKIPLEKLEADLAALNVRRDAAKAANAAAEGHQAGQAEQIRKQIAEKQAVPAEEEPALAAAEKEHTDLVKAAIAKQNELNAAREKVAQAQADAEGDRALPADAGGLDQAIADGEEAVKLQQDLVREAAAKGKELKEIIEGVSSGDHSTCRTCKQEVTKVHLDALKHEKDFLGKQWKEATEAEKKESEHLKASRAQKTAVDAIRARIAAQATIEGLEQTLGEIVLAARKVVGNRDAAAANVNRLREAQTRHRAHQQAQRDLVTLTAQLAEAELPPPAAGEPLAPIEKEIARVQALKAALDGVMKLERLQDDLADVEQTIREGNDLVAALGPKGARARLLARSLGPFLDASNQMLRQFRPEFELVSVIDADMPLVIDRRAPPAEASTSHGVSLGPTALSDGEKAAALYVMQYAEAKLSGAPVVVFDRTEVLDAAGQVWLKRFASQVSQEGIKTIVISCKPTPPAWPAGRTDCALEMVEGVGRLVPIAEPKKEAA